MSNTVEPEKFIEKFSRVLSNGKLPADIFTKIVDWAISTNSEEFAKRFNADISAIEVPENQHFVDVAKDLTAAGYPYTAVALYSKLCGCTQFEASTDLSEQFNCEMPFTGNSQEEVIFVLSQMKTPYSAKVASEIRAWLGDFEEFKKTRSIDTSGLIRQIRKLREITSAGLKESKTCVEEYILRHGILKK